MLNHPTILLLADVLDGLTHPSGNLFFDGRTAVLIREHGIRRIYTADVGFLQFSQVEAINPLRTPAQGPPSDPGSVASAANVL